MASLERQRSLARWGYAPGLAAAAALPWWIYWRFMNFSLWLWCHDYYCCSRITVDILSLRAYNIRIIKLSNGGPK